MFSSSIKNIHDLSQRIYLAQKLLKFSEN